MHSPFTPVPNWLDPLHRSTEPLFPAPETASFLDACFETLYRLGMSDRQVVEVTSLLICLSRQNRFHVPFRRGESSGSWYLNEFKFFRCFSRLDQKVSGWVEFFLSKEDLRNFGAQAFWSGSEKWIELFFDNPDEYRREVARTKNRFVQEFFGLNPTGEWNVPISNMIRKFQDRTPKSVIPWKTGVLDGFTFKFIARMWRKQRGIVEQ